MYDTKAMAIQDGKTESNLSTTPAPSSKTESSLSTTPTEKPSKLGRPSRKGKAPTPWSIRGVERDTRSVIEKAAERVGKTIGQYINEDVRSFAQGQLTQNQLPAAPIDIQNQIDHLTTIIESMASRMPEQGKQSFWKRVFG